MSALKGLFFDLDGTLVNTYEADYLAYRDAIKEVTGIDIDSESFAKTHGQEAKQKLDSLAPGLSDEDVERVRQAKKAHYPKYLHHTIPNDTLINFLRDMVQHHVTAIVTTAKSHNAEAVLEAHDLNDLFKIKVYGDDVRHAKPHPESYLLALKRSGLQAHEVIAFEDSQSGLDAAKAAGIATIHIRSFQ